MLFFPIASIIDTFAFGFTVFAAVYRRDPRRHLICIGVGVACAVLEWVLSMHAASAQVDTVPISVCGNVNDPSPSALDTSLQMFAKATYGWMDNTLTGVGGVFWTALLCECGWSAFELVPSIMNGARGLIGPLLMTVLGITLRSAAFTNAGTWIPDLVNGFFSLGTIATDGGFTNEFTSIGAVHLRGIMMQGLCLESQMSHAGDSLNVFQHIAFNLNILPGQVGTAIAYVILDTQLYLSTIEAYILMGIGAALTLFFATRATQNWAMQYVFALVTCGLTLGAVSTLIGLSFTLEPQWVQMLQSSPANIIEAIAIGMAAFTVALAAWSVPGIVALKLHGGAAMSQSIIISQVANVLRTAGDVSGGGGGGGPNSGADRSGGGSEPRSGQSGSGSSGGSVEPVTPPSSLPSGGDSSSRSES